MIKKKFKYRLVAATTACLLLDLSHSLALDSEVKLGGLYEFQSIYYGNNGKPEQKIVSKNNGELGFNTSGNIFVDYRLISENNNKYGTKISLEHTTHNNRAVPFLVYFESEFGLLEAGSDSSAGKKMRITGYNAAVAGGNSWSAIPILTPNVPTFARRVPGSPEKLVAYINNFCGFLDTKIRTPGKVEYSRKLTYFTPKLPISKDHQIQLGVSYVPDSSNLGHDNIDIDPKKTPAALVPLIPFKFVIKDGISYGIDYSGKFSNSLSGKISFVGETGKTLAFSSADNKPSNVKFKNLNTYVLGGELKYNKISVSAAYTNYNKSLTAKSVDLISRDSYAYGFGAKYSFDKYDISINQFNSSFKKSTLGATSLGLEYTVAKGFKTYIQSTFYQTNGKFLEKSNTINSIKSRGTLVLLGAKISF